MATDEKERKEIETGFGTGLRAKLGRPEVEEETPAPAAVAATNELPPLPANGEVNGDVEALRAELAAALERERDLRTELATQAVMSAPNPELDGFESDLAARAAELDLRAARRAASETAMAERERRGAEPGAMVRSEKERL